MSAEDSQKRVQRLVDDVRRELLELAEQQRDATPELSAQLAELATRLARAQGLSSAPLESSYRHQVRMFQRWLRARGLRTEPPLSAEVVLEYLGERSESIAVLTLRKDALAIKRWHQATGHPDPTGAEAIVALFESLEG